MTLSNKALTKLTTVNRRLGFQTGEDLDRDIILEELIEEVSADLVAACGRQFYNKSDHVERVKGFGDRILIVDDHVPISSITKIEYDDGTTVTEIDSSDYEIEDANRGLIRRKTGVWTFTGNYHYGPRLNRLHGTEKRLIKVTYSGGWVTPQQAHLEDTTRTLPRDLESVVIERIIQRYRNRNRDQSVISKKLGNASITWSNANSSAENPVDTRWLNIVARYKRGGVR